MDDVASAEERREVEPDASQPPSVPAGSPVSVR
jgi:hypothetical protein